MICSVKHQLTTSDGHLVNVEIFATPQQDTLEVERITNAITKLSLVDVIRIYGLPIVRTRGNHHQWAVIQHTEEIKRNLVARMKKRIDLCVYASLVTGIPGFLLARWLRDVLFTKYARMVGKGYEIKKSDERILRSIIFTAVTFYSMFVCGILVAKRTWFRYFLFRLKYIYGGKIIWPLCCTIGGLYALFV